jgi:hypothetical protein
MNSQHRRRLGESGILGRIGTLRQSPSTHTQSDDVMMQMVHLAIFLYQCPLKLAQIRDPPHHCPNRHGRNNHLKTYRSPYKLQSIPFHSPSFHPTVFMCRHPLNSAIRHKIPATSTICEINGRHPLSISDLIE